MTDCLKAILKPPKSNNFNAFDENQNYLGFAILAIYDYGNWYSNGAWSYDLPNGYRIRPGYIIMAKEHAGMTFQNLIDDFSGGQDPWRHGSTRHFRRKYLGVNFRYVARNNELICDFEDFFKNPLQTPTIET